MDFSVYLLSLSVSGIKNIEKELTIDFYRKKIGKDFSGRGYNVKAIYGENGSGKTAIVTAVDLLKKLLIGREFLSNLTNQRHLDEIVNKSGKHFSCECEFLLKTDSDIILLKYSIELQKSKYGQYYIKHEQLSYKSRTGTKYSTIYKCNSGEIEILKCSSESARIVKEKSANVLQNKTLIANTIILEDEISDSTFFSYIAATFLFGASIFTFFNTADYHDLYFLLKAFEGLESIEKFLKDYLNSETSNFDRIIGVREKMVEKNHFKSYEKKVQKLAAFLKKFKPELKDIEIEKKDNKSYYECSLILNYDDYSIDKEFESSGIKRLIDLFDYFNYAAEGKIVFIDEMDANINDVYLCKLVEYFMHYSKGQLCFTTHNTSPMSVLKSNKKSIDFLTNDNRIIPWKINGNYSPEKLYKAGMIEYLPFNIEAVDFVGILGGDED